MKRATSSAGGGLLLVRLDEIERQQGERPVEGIDDRFPGVSKSVVSECQGEQGEHGQEDKPVLAQGTWNLPTDAHGGRVPRRVLGDFHRWLGCNYERAFARGTNRGTNLSESEGDLRTSANALASRRNP